MEYVPWHGIKLHKAYALQNGVVYDKTPAGPINMAYAERLRTALRLQACMQYGVRANGVFRTAADMRKGRMLSMLSRKASQTPWRFGHVTLHTTVNGETQSTLHTFPCAFDKVI